MVKRIELKTGAECEHRSHVKHRNVEGRISVKGRVITHIKSKGLLSFEVEAKMQFQIWIFTLLFQETFPDMVAGNQKFLISRVHQPKTSLAGYSSTRCRLLKTSKIEQPAKWADLRADHTIQPFNFGAHTFHRIKS